MSGAAPNQFALLGQRRFAPFFWAQFLGAGNDNLFKFAFTVLVTYQLQVSWLPASMAGLVIGALFILPFLLFSATSGQLADKYDKAQLIRFVKSLEIAIMALAEQRELVGVRVGGWSLGHGGPRRGSGRASMGCDCSGRAAQGTTKAGAASAARVSQSNTESTVTVSFAVMRAPSPTRRRTTPARIRASR